MVLDNDTRIQQASLVNVATKQRGKPSGSPAFSDLLAEAVSENDAAEKTSKTTAASTNTVSGQPGLVKQLSSVIDLLANYSDALGDPGVSLRQIEPMLKNLQFQTDQLKSQASQSDDPDLSQLAGQIEAQVEAESIKFQRGDYV